MQARQAAVRRVEVPPQDDRPVIAADGGRGLGVADHAVAGDRLAEQVRVAFGVGGERGRLLRGDLRRVHPGDALRLRQLRVPGAEPQPHVAVVHRRAASERATGNGHVVLGGLVAGQPGLEPHEQRRVRGHGVPGRDAVDVLARGRQAGPHEPAPGRPPAQRGRDIKRPGGLECGHRRAPDQGALDRGEPGLVIGGDVQAQVVVIDGRQLEPGQCGGGGHRGGDPQHLGEVAVSPGGGEQQPGGLPRVAALQRPQRGFEQPGVRRRRGAVDVEKQQPAEPRRHRVAGSVPG